MTGPYSLAYAAAWVIFAAGIVAGAISGAYLAHVAPSWVTEDIARTCALVSTVCVGIAAALPSIRRTPGARETNYLRASMGQLPPDLAKQHPLVVPPTTAEPPPSRILPPPT